MDIKHPFHAFPVFLHHASLPPVVANDAGTEAEARANGYSEEFIGHEYPKMVHAEVADAKEQAMAQAHGFVYSGAVDAPYSHTVSRTFKSAEEESAAGLGRPATSDPVAVDPDEKAVEVPEGK